MNKEIIIVAPGMPFADTTLEHRSLGGSETAALSLAKALRAKGHIVTVFCILPDPGKPDHMGPNGGLGADGTRYLPMEQYQQFIGQTQVDLLIAQRTPQLLEVQHQAKKAVLWCHDLATYHGPQKALQGVAWNFDELWCVSEWHRQQYHKVSGYPLDHIKVLRNAITAQDIMPGTLFKISKQMVYAARPERGLEALVRPGGIMSRLEDFTLKVCFYDNFPPHLEDYYGMLFSMAKRLPNVEVIGPRTQFQLRCLMEESDAYIYPTNFEETSCILAQEAMERGLLFLTTRKGALPETLGDYGDFYDGPGEYCDDDFCEGFAQHVRDCFNMPHLSSGGARYWSDAADDVISMVEPVAVTDFSRFRSLVEDSDIIAALTFADNLQGKNAVFTKYVENTKALYPYLDGRETFASYYERYFVREDSKGARIRRGSQSGNPRFEAIAREVEALPAGAKVIDYGCAEGVIILDLAARFPDKQFTGVDFAATNIALCKHYAEDLGLSNTFFVEGSTDNWPDIGSDFDAVICTEVLEHVVEPWHVIGVLERRVKVGGRVITTVPAGPWEALGLYDKDQYPWRAHIWHIDKWMLRTMFADKSNVSLQSLPGGYAPDGRAIGHTVCAYEADHAAPYAISALEKATLHRARHTATACVITNRSDCLKRLLNSLSRSVQAIYVDVNSNSTNDYIDISHLVHDWQKANPWMITRVRMMPEIKVNERGFDEARNECLDDVMTDLVLWIDEDEYLSGPLQHYYRANAFDSYAIHQHHFTVDPRGAPTQLDKPARMFRLGRGFQFYGKVHEHAEKGPNGGPGFAFSLPNVDIGHTGYVNEGVRRSRFSRNFPFLEWDHRTNPERKLGKFLWLRDMLHRLRYMHEHGEMTAARALAEEAVEYYDANWNSWTDSGQGGENALGYRSEALAFLNRGLPVHLQLKVGDDTMSISGVFEGEADVSKALEAALKGKFAERRSGYWQ